MLLQTDPATGRGLSRRLWVILGASSLSSMAMAMYRGVISNFAVGELHLGPVQYGLLDGAREVPGLLLVVLAGAAARLSEEHAFTLWTALMASGIALHAVAGGFGLLLAATSIFSIGLHLWDVGRDVLVMDAAPASQRGLRLGQVGGAGAAAGVVGMGLIWWLAPGWSLRHFFVAAGVFGLAAAVLTLPLRKTGRPAPPRAAFAWRREHRPLYLLSLLTAAREMVSITVATYLLVQAYRTPAATMALLLALAGVLALAGRPLAGRLTDRIGPERALALNYAAVGCAFVGYAFVHWYPAVCALYVLDLLLSGFADLALAAYAARLVAAPELGVALAMSNTLAHVVAVPFPVLAGALWGLGVAAPFLLGAAIALAAMLYALQRAQAVSVSAAASE